MVPFSASNGFGSEAIVYGASIVLVFDQKLLLRTRLLSSPSKKSPAPVSVSAQSSLGFGGSVGTPRPVACRLTRAINLPQPADAFKARHGESVKV
jgi:hypothetical protein